MLFKTKTVNKQLMLSRLSLARNLILNIQSDLTLGKITESQAQDLFRNVDEIIKKVEEMLKWLIY